MEQHFPIIVVELIMVFGGALAFGWWQLRDIKKDQLKAQRELEQSKDLLHAQHDPKQGPKP